MDWDKVVYEHLLGELETEFIVSFYVVAFIGMFLSLLIHYSSKKEKERKAGNKTPFDVGFWIKDNGRRMLATVIIIFIAMRLPGQVGWSGAVDMGFAFIVGFGMDGLIILFRKKSKIALWFKSR